MREKNDRFLRYSREKKLEKFIMIDSEKGSETKMRISFFEGKTFEKGSSVVLIQLIS